MGIFSRLFRKQETNTQEVSNIERPPASRIAELRRKLGFQESKVSSVVKSGEPQHPTADYSFVEDPNGQILGLWLQNPENSRKTAVLVTLLMKHQGRLAEVRKPIGDELIKMVVSQNYRVVPNNFDQDGGCFLMFGSALAPGEEERRDRPDLERPDNQEINETAKRNNVAKFGEAPSTGADANTKVCAICETVCEDSALQCSKCGSGVFGSRKSSGATAQYSADRTKGLPSTYVVPISEYHVLFDKLSKSINAPTLDEAYENIKIFCDKCGFQFTRNALDMLYLTGTMGLFVVGGSKGGNDLRSGRCPHCGYTHIRVESGISL